MAVYLGNQGVVELKRDSFNDPLASDLDPGDVNAAKKRFSFDFEFGALITGDQVDIKTADGTDLEFIDGSKGDGWRGYLNIDDAGGIRAYKTFPAAVSGKLADALTLTAPTKTKKITVTTRGSDYRCLGQVTDYELTNTRDAVDCTSLGEEFRRNYANGMISGQGALNAIWEYKAEMCDEMIGPNSEFPHYLAQLVIRMQQGSDFIGRFFLHIEKGSAVWQDATCIVTNVGITVDPLRIIRTNIQFVTTGQIRLRMGDPPSYLLLEADGGKMLQQNNSAVQTQDCDGC